ncbi:MAG TPA: hypothetical protein GX697_02340 [Firmicutes bacterium]|nr:hypothetical protein [Bacillota bacterium]
MTAALLVLLLFLSLTTSVWAAAPREAAMAYLVEKHNVSAGRVWLSEGETMVLELLNEKFWVAKYEIVPEGAEPPKPEVNKDLPPDTPVTDRMDIMPVEPEKPDYINGAVYIKESTGEIFTQEEMEPYFLEERRLAQEKWEKLTREAGKLDVYLYQKLAGLDAAEKVKVIILPAFTLTDELKRKCDDLAKQFPDMQMPPDYFGLFSSSGFVTPPVLTPDGGAEIAGGGSSPGQGAGPEDVEKRYEIEEQTNLFYEKLEAIRLEGLAVSAGIIKAKLEDMGIVYEELEGSGSLAAELTAAEAREVAELETVYSIMEDEIHYAVDVDDTSRVGEPGLAAEGGEADTELKEGMSYYWILAAIITMGVAFLGYRCLRPQKSQE